MISNSNFQRSSCVTHCRFTRLHQCQQCKSLMVDVVDDDVDVCSVFVFVIIIIGSNKE